MCQNRRKFLAAGILTATAFNWPALCFAAETRWETEAIPRRYQKTFGSGSGASYEKIIRYAIYGPRLSQPSLKALRQAMDTIGQQFVNPHHVGVALNNFKDWGVVGHPKIPHFRGSRNAFIDWVALQWNAMRAFSGFPFVNIYLSDSLQSHGLVTGSNIGRVVHYHQGIGIAASNQAGYSVAGIGNRGPGFLQIHLDRSKLEKTPSPRIWCQVIAHEILHNMGHTHPKGQKGSFIEEFQKSIGDKAPSGSLNLSAANYRITCGV